MTARPPFTEKKAFLQFEQAVLVIVTSALMYSSSRSFEPPSEPPSILLNVSVPPRPIQPTTVTVALTVELAAPLARVLNGDAAG